MQADIYTALKQTAAVWILPDQARVQTLKHVFSQISDWQALAAAAEIHGLSVYLGRLAHEHELDLPRSFALQLKALTLRHQKAQTAREVVISDVINTFNTNNITFALLKGAALAHLIYTPSWTRPMRDIDILVKLKDAVRAQKLLRTIDFENKDSISGYLSAHHHLPNSTRKQDGFTISLEVHHDALSGDVDHSIKLDKLSASLHAFNLADNQAFALGAVDMLMHLCHHSFEPADTIKLGSLVDLVRYSHQHLNDIKWAENKAPQKRINNTLICIHALLPLPEPLLARLKQAGYAPFKQAPAGTGKGFLPLSQQHARLANKRDKFHALLIPSTWWMHIFYVVKPEQSLLVVRFWRHPINIAKWILRRYRAAAKNPAI